jgi:hypothetical protein
MSARQDVEDMQLEAQKRQAMRRWEAQYDAGNSADVSAPSELQREKGAQMQARAKRYREKEYDRLITLRMAGKVWR